MYVLVDNRDRFAGSLIIDRVFTYTSIATAQIAKRLLDERDENFYKIVEV